VTAANKWGDTRAAVVPIGSLWVSTTRHHPGVMIRVERLSDTAVVGMKVGILCPDGRRQRERWTARRTIPFASFLRDFRLLEAPKRKGRAA
jgi:hypothetical protein